MEYKSTPPGLVSEGKGSLPLHRGPPAGPRAVVCRAREGKGQVCGCRARRGAVAHAGDNRVAPEPAGSAASSGMPVMLDVPPQARAGPGDVACEAHIEAHIEPPRARPPATLLPLATEEYARGIALAAHGALGHVEVAADEPKQAGGNAAAWPPGPDSGSGGPAAAEPAPAGNAPGAAHLDGDVWWIAEVPRQLVALLTKNLILARRNRTSTFVRTFASLFFMLLIFLVNEGLKGRYSTLAYFQDLKDATRLRTTIAGIPQCVPSRGYSSCVTFAYSPAPRDEYVPDTDYESVEKFAEGMKAANIDTCHSSLGACTRVACDIAGMCKCGRVRAGRRTRACEPVRMCMRASASVCVYARVCALARARACTCG